jgi:preprotein translocase subunit SecD
MTRLHRFSFSAPALVLAAALGACSSQAPAPPEPAATEPPPAPAEPTTAAVPATPTGPTKTLKLRAAGASDAQLQQTVSILNERLRLANLPGAARQAGGGLILVTLQDDAAVLERAANLLLSGGELIYYPLVTEKQMKAEDIQKTIAEIRAAKEAGSYDRVHAKYDIAKWKDKDEWGLVENPGVPGYLLSDVEATTDDNGKPAISFTMTEAGSAEYYEFTKRIVGRQEADVFDGQIALAATIQEPIEGSGRVTGNFTEQEVADLVTILKSGKLPVELNLEAE